MSIASIEQVFDKRAQHSVETYNGSACKFCGEIINLFVHKNSTRSVEGIISIIEDGAFNFFNVDVVGHDDCLRLANAEIENKIKQDQENKINNYFDSALKKLRTKFPIENGESKNFSTIKVSEGNCEAIKILKAWDFRQDDFGIILSGPSGSGKTHAMCSLAEKIFTDSFWSLSQEEKLNDTNEYHNGQKSIIPLIENSTKFFNECHSNEFKVPTKYRFAKVLFLDDLGSENITEMKREWIYSLLEERKNYGLITFITTNLSLSDLKEKFYERISSRILELCVPVMITGKDMRMEKAKQRLDSLKARIT